MKVKKLPAATIKALLHLTTHPQARLIIVEECAYLLDGNSKVHKHTHIPDAAFTVLRENGWITPPQVRSEHLAECTIAQGGHVVAASLVALQSQFHQLKFDAAILDAHITASAAPTQIEEVEQAEEQEASSTSDQPEETQAEPATSEAATTEQPAPTKKRRKTSAPTKKRRKTIEEAKAASIAKRVAMQKNMQQAVSSLLESIKAGKSERLLQYLSFSAKFHHYSPLNQLMIAFQAPNATHVAGYTTWQNLGYQVRGGEKGIAILAPRPFAKVTKTNEETGEEETIGYQGVTFRVAYVFDVSQLEENPKKPLPTFFIPLAGDQEALYTRIAQAVRAEGIIVEIGDTGSAQGYSAGGRIRLREGLDSTNRCLTLIHEYAHEKLHHNTVGQALSTEKKECHAEAISYVVAHHFGVDNPYSSDYLQNWGTTEKELLAELETIKTTANAIIEAIETQEEQEVSTTDQDASMYPPCFYCQQPAAENAQILNGVSVCAACIAQEIASVHPDEIIPPTEPEPPTPTDGPTSTEPAEPEPPTPTESQETEPEPKAPARKPETTPSKRQAGKQGAERISLNGRANAFTVSHEGYKKIEALIQEYATCHRCEEYYSEEAPNVAGNLCLQCFLHWSGRNTGLTYVGPGTPREDGTPEYIFLDRRGMVHVSNPGPSYSDEARESYTETLKYWSFHVPEYIEKNGNSISVRGAYWNICGDPRKSVVIAHIWDTYPDKVEAFYLLSKTGKMIQINKRKASHRQLFTEARNRLEASKRNGQYHIDGESYNYINEWHEWRMIASMIDQNPRLWP